MASLPSNAKGKGRVTETTPLLSNGSTSTSAEAIPVDAEQQLAGRQQERRLVLQRTLTNVFLGSLAAVVVALVLGALLLYSYIQRARGVGPDELVNAIVFRGPTSVDVIEVKDGGEIVLDVKGLIGVDTDKILGFRTNDEDEDGVFVSIWKDIGRWGVGFLREVTVDIGQVVAHEARGGDPLAKTSARPFTVPLSSRPGKPSDAKWLKPISLHITAQPTHDAGLLQRFAQETWERALLDVNLELDQVRVRGGNAGVSGGWRSMIQAKRKDLTMPFRYKIPDVPGLPDPRPPLIKLLQLVSYSLLPEGDKLSIYALATIPSPLSGVKFYLPRIPYEVSLLAPPLTPLPISTGTVIPALTPPNISLPITGEIIPLSTPDSSIVLSSFLSQFLSGIPPPISLRSPLLPNLIIETTFPVPDPLPKILENVTIRHMSMAVAPNGGMLASGEVWATIALPPGLHIPINVTHVWPDVLLYDGLVTPQPDPHNSPPLSLPELPEVRLPNITIPHLPKIEIPHPNPPVIPGKFPWRHTPTSDDPPPLPDPLPDRAFARIRPTGWVIATTVEPCDGPDDIVESEGWVLLDGNYRDCARAPDGAGWKTTVTASIDRVPLQVLPGRDKEFRSFVSKVLWSKDGATAGIKGVAAVKSIVPGLLEGGKGGDAPSLELHGLPFEGSVFVGKKGL